MRDRGGREEGWGGEGGGGVKKWSRWVREDSGR